MTGHMYDLLRALSKGPRTLRSFTHSPTVEQTRVSPYVIELNMSKLVAAGYVGRTAHQYWITAEGMAQIDLSMPKPPAGYSRENFTGTKWQIRPGGSDHEQYKSRGMGA